MPRVPEQATIPLWLKVSFTIMASTVISVYVVQLPLDGLLWFSDIALILLLPALWFESRTISSTMAVGVFVLEASTGRLNVILQPAVSATGYLCCHVG